MQSEKLSTMFIILWTISLFVMAIAIFNRKKIGKQKTSFFIVLPSIFFILGAITLPPQENKVVENKTTEVVQEKEKPAEKIKDNASILKEKIESKLDVDVYVSYSKSDCVSVTFPISDNLFKDSRIRGGQRDMIAILAEYKELVWDKNASACITGTFPSVDQYGNINQKEPAMMITVDYKTLMKMNLGNMDDNPALLDNYDLYSYILFPYMRG
jgi:hypothetical protein